MTEGMGDNTGTGEPVRPGGALLSSVYEGWMDTLMHDSCLCKTVGNPDTVARTDSSFSRLYEQPAHRAHARAQREQPAGPGPQVSRALWCSANPPPPQHPWLLPGESEPPTRATAHNSGSPQGQAWEK
eukprot:GHVU01065900.1.p3 GENE.GHVU01065900.1~~GHVU01065900.1.p3  ORF type:complete len:128 (+),score=3.83 GHVU01065900.1:141-524(+)